MNIRDIRAALAAALVGQGFRVYDVLPEAGQLPLAAVSWPEEIRFHQSAGDGVVVDIVVTVAVSLTDFARAQKDIDDVMSTPGLGTVIENHVTTAWFTATCESAGHVRQINVGAEALAVDLQIVIYA